MIRATRRALVAMLIAAAVMMLLPAVATAGPFGCDPESPTPAHAGKYVNPPKPMPPADATFQGPKFTQFDLYGITGYRYHMYDLGCGPNVAERATSGNVNGFANHMLAGAQMFIGWGQSVTEAALNPQWMNVFDGLLRDLTGALHQQIFLKWFAVALALAGVIALAVTVRHGDIAGTATRITAAVGIIAVVTLATNWPVWLGQTADRTVTGTVDYVAAGITGNESAQGAADQVGSTLTESVLYRQWLRGSLGPGNTPIRPQGEGATYTGKRLGPILFDAQVLNWQEAKNYRNGTSEQREKILENHKKQWEDAAEDVQNTNTYAYEHLTGKQADTRFGSGFFALAGSFLSSALLILTGILVIFALLVIRLAIIAIPIVGLLALANPTGFGGPLWNLIDRGMLGPVLQATTAGIITVLYIPVLETIITAGQVPWWLRFVLLFMAFVATWMGLKPLRKLTRGASHFTQTGREMGQAAAGWPGRTVGHAKNAGKFVGRTAAGAAVGGYVGAAAANAGWDSGQDTQQQESEPDPQPQPEPTTAASSDAGEAPAQQRQMHKPAPAEIQPAGYGYGNGAGPKPGEPGGAPRGPDGLISPGSAPPNAPVVDPDEYGTYNITHDPRNN